MKYKIIQRVNPQDRTQSNWYATPVNDGRIDKNDLSKEIVNISALSRGDVSDAIESLLDVIPKYLLMGKSVSLGELGTMRVSFGSKGVEDPKKFHTNLISGVRIVFTPSTELKDQLNRMHFELSHGQDNDPETDDNNDEDDDNQNNGPVED
ncbi:MAG: HU family DNA-binding protein [Tannerellaceae bacterium]|jgi:predicted histone-like DNA-binding protein|nr:HU family DNA-binding protein [Tannerellaceae bacterium]